jgi:hypothetical protein|nr:MAG TPA: hypothetical protein [Caudoviricetes sp.]
MQSVLKTADDLWIGDLIIYTNTLHVVSEQRLTVDGEHVASLLIKPYLSDGPLTRIEVLRNPGYRFRCVTVPIFAVEPCDDKMCDVMAVAVYTGAHKAIVADYVGSSVRSDGSLPLENGDIAHYGDVIALINNGTAFEHRLVDKYALAKHARLITIDTEAG